MLFIALSADPSSAQSPGLHAGKPGQVREVIAPAATVIATDHYQVELALTCGGGTACSGNFPKPGNKRRLNIMRMSCYVAGASGSTFDLGYADLKSAANAHIQYQWLPVDHSSPAGSHTLNRAVDIQVGSQQHIGVYLELSGGTASQGYCTASGTLETLQ
jgi:hypothetical protein